MKKFTKVLISTLTACFGLSGIIASNAFADDATPQILIQVSPVSTQVILEAGKSKEYTMTVKNSGASDFSYHLYTTYNYHYLNIIPF